MDGKKVSFGFSKITKKPALVIKSSAKEKETNKVELIKCLEGQEFEVVGGPKKEEAPLVIPVQENRQTSSAIASFNKRRAVLLGEDEAPSDAQADGNGQEANDDQSKTVDVSNETLEQRAARELLAAAQGSNEDTSTQSFVVPVVKPEDLPLDGAKESTLDDYDSIPIEQFGLAMLRGMGWKDAPKKKKAAGPDDGDMVFVRPKGMGLGADKALKPKPLLVAPEQNEKLEIKKGACVRIIGGHHKDAYARIEGFDDHAGRIIVKMAIGGNKEVFNEFLCQPVSKKEFEQYGKCINSVKYEAYKKLENEHGQIVRPKQEVKSASPALKEEKHFKKEKYSESSERSQASGRSYSHKDEYGDRQRRDQHRYHDDYKNKRETGSTREYKSERDYDRKSDRNRARDNEERDHSSYSRNGQGHRHRSNSPASRRDEYNQGEYDQRKQKDDESSDSTKSSSSSEETSDDSSHSNRREHRKKSTKSKSKSKKKKSHSKKKSSKKHKSREADSSGDNSSSDDEYEDDRRRTKQKGKRSKRDRQRSRTPTRRRR